MTTTPGPSAAHPYDQAYYEGGGTRSHYRDYADASALVHSVWLPLIERHRRWFSPRASGRALDVGCAYGFLVQAYQQRGWQAEGCDISEFAIQRGRERGIEGLHLGSVDALALPGQSYDLITCLDVIEHLPPAVYKAYLAEFQRLLKPGGFLFVATPNRLDCSGYNVFSEDWVEGDPTHINYRARHELLEEFSEYPQRIVHGFTPMRGMFDSFRSFRGVPRVVNGLFRWLMWRLLRDDPNHGVYLIVAARR